MGILSNSDTILDKLTTMTRQTKEKDVLRRAVQATEVGDFVDATTRHNQVGPEVGSLTLIVRDMSVNVASCMRARLRCLSSCDRPRMQRKKNAKSIDISIHAAACAAECALQPMHVIRDTRARAPGCKDYFCCTEKSRHQFLCVCVVSLPSDRRQVLHSAFVYFCAAASSCTRLGG